MRYQLWTEVDVFGAGYVSYGLLTSKYSLVSFCMKDDKVKQAYLSSGIDAWDEDKDYFLQEAQGLSLREVVEVFDSMFADSWHFVI